MKALNNKLTFIYDLYYVSNLDACELWAVNQFNSSISLKGEKKQITHPPFNTRHIQTELFRIQESPFQNPYAIYMKWQDKLFHLTASTVKCKCHYMFFFAWKSINFSFDHASSEFKLINWPTEVCFLQIYHTLNMCKIFRWLCE